MKVTKELLKRLFDEYNKLYFDGKLGKCNFSFFTKNKKLCKQTTIHRLPIQIYLQHTHQKIHQH